MFGYIYITTNELNGMKYVGQHKATTFDPNYLGSGIHLKEAVSKYGKRNFSVKLLCECDSAEELDRAEINYIKTYNAVNSKMFYNISAGGQGLAGSPMLGKHHTTLTKEKISNAHRGVPKTKEHRDALSAARKSLGLSKGENNPMFGKHRFGDAAPNSHKKAINNGVITKLINPLEFDRWEKLGFKWGGLPRKRSSSRVAASRANISEKASFTTAGYRWFKNVNTFETLYVKISDSLEEELLKKGFVRGCLTKEELHRKEVNNNNV